jgi:non-ribosomal peptide synthetase component F
VLLRELATPEGTGPAVQYADYAAWQLEWLAGRSAEQLGYWRRQLAGAQPSELPPDLPRPKVWTGRGHSLAFAVPSAVAVALRKLGRAHGATSFMTFLAAFQALLARATEADETTIGTPVAGRPTTETEDLIGYFANVLVLRADLRGDPTFLQLLERTREMALAAYGHQDVPYDQLVAELRQKRDLSRNPLFQIMFEVSAEQPSYLPELPAEPEQFEIPWPTSMYDLTVSLINRPDGGYFGIAEYAADLYHSKTIEALLAGYLDLLHTVANDPGTRLSRMATSRQHLLRGLTVRN